MTIINGEKLNTLKADEGMHLRNVNDVYIPEHNDGQGNVVPEHFPYYFEEVYLPLQITLEKAQELYVEEKIEKR